MTLALRMPPDDAIARDVMPAPLPACLRVDFPGYEVEEPPPSWPLTAWLLCILIGRLLRWLARRAALPAVLGLIALAVVAAEQQTDRPTSSAQLLVTAACRISEGARAWLVLEAGAVVSIDCAARRAEVLP